MGYGGRHRAARSKRLSIFRCKQLHFRRLVNARSGKLHPTGRYFMKVCYLSHVYHAIQIIQISLPATVEISQTTPITIQERIHASCHIAGIKPIIIMYRFVDASMVIYTLHGRLTLHLPVFKDCRTNIGRIGYDDSIFIDRRSLGWLTSICRIVDFRRMFLGIHENGDLLLQRIDRHRYIDFIGKGKSIDTLAMQNRDMGIHAGLEIFPRAQVLRCPANLCHGQGARKHHVFQMFRCRDIFCPRIALHAHEVFFFLCRQGVFRDRIIAIDFLDGCVTADSIRLGIGEGLIEIQVHVIAWCHHDIMSHTD